MQTAALTINPVSLMSDGHGKSRYDFLTVLFTWHERQQLTLPYLMKQDNDTANFKPQEHRGNQLELKQLALWLQADACIASTTTPPSLNYSIDDNLW